MQLGPALSPDGRQAVFFSERDRLSLDLFLADVATGRIVRKLATTAASARFDSLQPLRSAGAWSPDGEWFAFRGRAPGPCRADAARHARAAGSDREIVFNELGQVLSPTWSPDGQAIAFSALAGGFTDLYVYDLATRHAAAAHRRCVCRSASGVVARRPLDRVCHRTLFERSGRAAVRPAAARDDRCRRRGPCVALDVGGNGAQLNPQWSSRRSRAVFRRRCRRDRNVFRVDLRHVGARAGSPTWTPASAASRRRVPRCRSPTQRRSWPSPSTNAAGRSSSSSTGRGDWRRSRVIAQSHARPAIRPPI